MKEPLEKGRSLAIEYIISRLKKEGEQVVVGGKITSIRVMSNLLRQFGGAYTGDSIEASMDYKPEYLPCDFIIDDLDQKITKAGSGVILVKEVVQQLSKELDAIVAATMAAHEQTLQEALNPPKEDKSETIMVRASEVF